MLILSASEIFFYCTFASDAWSIMPPDFELDVSDYDRILRKGFTSEEVVAGLKELGSLLREPAEALVIGEAPLVLRGWKKVCNQIELVFTEDSALESFIDALQQAEYEETLYMRYKKYLTFDLYLKSFSEYIVSQQMLDRAFPTELGRLKADIASPEDIILLNSSSLRDSDYMDIRLLLNKIKPDWDVIVSELDRQVNQLDACDYSAIMLLATVNDLRRRKYRVPDHIPGEIVRTIQRIPESFAEA